MIATADRETESISARRERCQMFLRLLTEAAAEGQPVLTSLNLQAGDDLQIDRME